VDPELTRQNIRFALVLLAVILVLFVGSVIVAIIYNALS
jgi:hypothetical protein